MRSALTIAGSDPGAGAGIQADLKTFAALGVYGVSAVTAITAQNTAGISDVFALPPHTVRSQLDRLLEDIEVSAIKTGMLANAGIVRVVADVLGTLARPNLVIDPVMAATGPARPSTAIPAPASGGETEDPRTLLTPDAVSLVMAHLLPLAAVVTPNVAEATALSGIWVDSLDAAREAAGRILALGPAAVVITGGHLTGGQAIDLLYHDGAFTELTAPRSGGGPVHGTGCAFASAVAAGLALGDDIPSAVRRAKGYVTGAIERSIRIGRGARVLDHFWDTGRGLYSS